VYFRSVGNASQTQQEYVTKEQYDKLLFEYEYLKQQLADLKRMIFGSKSERFVASDDSQLSLFDRKEEQVPGPEKIEVSYQKTKPNKEKKSPIRVALPAHLPRVEEIIEPDDIDENDRKIGEEITEILEYNPSRVYVRKIIRPKYEKQTNKVLSLQNCLLFLFQKEMQAQACWPGYLFPSSSTTFPFTGR